MQAVKELEKHSRARVEQRHLAPTNEPADKNYLLYLTVHSTPSYTLPLLNILRTTYTNAFALLCAYLLKRCIESYCLHALERIAINGLLCQISLFIVPSIRESKLMREKSLKNDEIMKKAMKIVMWIPAIHVRSVWKTPFRLEGRHASLRERS